VQPGLVGFGDAAALEIVLYDSSGTPVPNDFRTETAQGKTFARIGSLEPGEVASWSASSCDQPPDRLASRARPAVQARPDSEYLRPLHGGGALADASGRHFTYKTVMNSPGPMRGSSPTR